MFVLKKDGSLYTVPFDEFDTSEQDKQKRKENEDKDAIFNSRRRTIPSVIVLGSSVFS
jgi:hypothetical protein